MELEMKGVVEMCKFLALNPYFIREVDEIQNLFDFCFASLSKCNCTKKMEMQQVESQYASRMLALSKATLDVLAKQLDPQNQYSSITISFPDNEQIIKLK